MTFQYLTHHTEHVTCNITNTPASIVVSLQFYCCLGSFLITSPSLNYVTLNVIRFTLNTCKYKISVIVLKCVIVIIMEQQCEYIHAVYILQLATLLHICATSEFSRDNIHGIDYKRLLDQIVPLVFINKYHLEKRLCYQTILLCIKNLTYKNNKIKKFIRVGIDFCDIQ